jgi:hypothetical protein
MNSGLVEAFRRIILDCVDCNAAPVAVIRDTKRRNTRHVNVGAGGLPDAIVGSARKAHLRKGIQDMPSTGRLDL